MISSIVSPYLAPTSKPVAPSAARPAAEDAAVAAPADVVVSSATSESASASASEPVKLSGATRAGAAVMAGVALLGAGLLAPTAAQAQPRGGWYGHSQVYTPPPPVYHQHHHHGGGGNAAGAFVLGAIIGGVIGSQMPYPSYPVPVPVPAPMPMPSQSGYEGYGVDGQYHHFDQFGHVADQTGHYQLQRNQWGQIYRVEVPPHY